MSVSVNPSPAALALTGSTICPYPVGNGTITSSTSETGVSYQLFNSGNVAVQLPQAGTGSGLSWSGLTAGTGYYVTGTGTNTCTSTSNAVDISTWNDPALVLTGSTICTSPGGTGTITSTTSVIGISYQLYNSANNPVQAAKAGTGSGLTWSGLAAGNGYYVTGTDSHSCGTPSNTVNVSTYPNPVALALTGSTICTSPGGNGTITSTTSVSGVNYQLYDGGNNPVQSAKAGTGSGLTWSGLAAGNGYYVIGTDSHTCTSTSNAVNVSTYTNPVALALTGSTICTSPGGNGTITSTTSVSGVSYQLYTSGGNPVQSAQAGTGSGLTWSGLAAGNGYYVIGTDSHTCTSTSNTVNVSTYTNPVALALTGSTICTSPGGTGTITSTTSVSGVSYQLYTSGGTPVQSAQAGTGSGLTWSGLAAGNGYYVIGTDAHSCTSTSNAVNVSTYTNPVALALTGSTICTSPGGTGTITSTTSVSGVNYQLYDGGNNPIQSAKAGTGSGLTWSGLAAGNGYYVIGTDAHTCTSASNAVNVSTYTNPVALSLTGSTICTSPGGTGTITSTTSVSGVNYQLYDGGNNPVQTAKAGTGSGLTWSGLAAGNGYYAIGTDAHSCTSTSNAVNISTYTNPIALIITGNTICASPGNNGTITSTTSVSGVSYQLYNGSNNPVQLPQAGTGSALAWFSLAAGNGYYVIGTDVHSCTSTSNIVDVSTWTNPVALILTGSTICQSPGGNGTITSTTSVSGISYQLYNGGNNPVQSAQTGTGSGLTWSGLPAGNGYYVIGTDSHSCTSTSGSVNIGTYTNPDALVLTGSTICTSPGGNGTITSSTSVAGVSYQLYDAGNSPVQIAQTGTGAALTWSGLAAGNGYYVIGTDLHTCASMSNSVDVSTWANPVPTISGPTQVCINSTETYYTETGMTGYSWNVTGGTINSGDGTYQVNVTWNTAGAQTISVNYTDGNGCTAVDPTVYDVTVTDLPAASISYAGTPFCTTVTTAQPVTLSGTTGGTYSALPAGLFLDATTGDITPSLSTAGTYTVTYTVPASGGCGIVTTTTSVTITTLPTASITYAGTPFCTSLETPQPVTLTGTDAYTGGTFTSNAGLFIDATTGDITPGLSNPGTYTVTYTVPASGGCGTITATTSVTINASPVPTINGSDNLCVDTYGYLYTTQAGMTNYIWTVSAGGSIESGGTTTDNTITLDWLTAGPQTITVNYTNSENCTANTPGVLNVTVNPRPDPSLSGPTTVCTGIPGNVYTTDPGMSTYYWYIPGSATVTAGGTSTDNTVTITWNSSGTQPLAVNYLNSYGCFALSATGISVSVNDLPVALSLTGSTICASPGGNGTITSSSSNVGVNYQLYDGSDNPVQAAQAGTGSGLTWSGLAAGTGYYVIGTIGSTCSSTSNVVDILTVPNPVALALTGSTICTSPGGNGTITSSASDIGVSYQLYDGSDSPVQLAQAGTGSGLTWSGLSAGNGYYVIGTDANTCTSTSNSADILTYPNPVALVLTGSTICASPGGNGTITSSTSDPRSKLSTV